MSALLSSSKMGLSHRLNLCFCAAWGEEWGDVEAECLIFHTFVSEVWIVPLLELLGQKWEGLALEGGQTQQEHGSPTAWQPSTTRLIDMHLKAGVGSRCKEQHTEITVSALSMQIM